MIEKIGQVHTKISSMRANQHFSPFNFTMPENRVLPDTFVRNDSINESKNNIIKKTAAILSGVLGIVVLLNLRNIKNAYITKKYIRIFKSEAEKFPKDLLYKKQILKDMNLPEKEYYKLRPIIGAEELTDFVKKLSKTPEIYTPGSKSYHETGEVQFLNRENVNNYKFGANLHMHTVNSDGKLTVSELLEQAAAYADKRAAKNKQPFVIAITNHDSVHGCKEAIEAVLKNPLKYRNIRLALGIENTTIFKNDKLLSKPVHIHLLAYGINPYGKDAQRLFLSKIEKNKNNIQNALEYANLELAHILKSSNLKYSFEDFVKMVPNINSGVVSADGYIKDFLQFRLIFANKVENNYELKEFLNKNKINIDDLNFTMPVKLIPQNLDYSKGQTYWGYYYEALQKLIVDKVKAQNKFIDEAQIIQRLPDITGDLKNTLFRIEAECLNNNSKMHVEKIDFPSFEDTVKNLSLFSEGIMGIAHPGVFFPKNALRNKEDMIKLYDSVYENFTALGGEKAKFAEDNYQVYFQSFSDELLENFSRLSSSYGLIKTGGLDTHAKDIFKSKY